jgi:hypothetical protein
MARQTSSSRSTSGRNASAGRGTSAGAAGKAPAKAAPKPVSAKTSTLAVAPPKTTTRRSATSAPTAKRSEDKNTAPSQWGRRMARLVGEKFGVQMSENHSKNEGIYKRKDIVIKCAKSTMPPVSVLVDMLERIDQLWAVYVMPDGTAEVWATDADKVREQGYFTHGPNVAKRVEIHLRKISKIGKLVGTLTEDEVESCRIP